MFIDEKNEMIHKDENEEKEKDEEEKEYKEEKVEDSDINSKNFFSL